MDETLFAHNQNWALKVCEVYLQRRRVPVARYLPGQFEQSALVALWGAVQRYDPERGPFRRYAFRRIVGSLRDEMRKAGAVWSHKCSSAPAVASLDDPKNNDRLLKSLRSPRSHDGLRMGLDSLEHKDRRAYRAVIGNILERRTLAELGRELSLTPSRVLQLREAGLSYLRELEIFK